MSEFQSVQDDIHPVFELAHASPQRLIHLIPDELAEVVPEHPLFSFPKTEYPRDGFTDVSTKCFANAINRTAWWLVEKLGKPSHFETVAYIGSSNSMLFTSPRNNLDGHVNVLEKSDCQIFLYASDSHTDVQPILERRPMRTLTVPTLKDLLGSSPAEVYPYNKVFEDDRHDPCLILHTTGSTGLPKPIIWKMGMLTTYEAWRLVPSVDDYVLTTTIYQQATRAYTSMPLFHTSGINAAITWALCLGVPLVYGDPHVAPNAAYVAQMHQFSGADATMGAPSIYEELSSREEWLEGLKRMHYVVATPLSHKAGNIMTRYSRVIGNLGATETANLHRLAPAPDDWEYFYWHPTHSGIELRPDPDSDSGLHELFIVRGGPDLEPFQGSMNDLYDRHATKPFLWRYRGRKDDVIIFNNGEKITPPLMETALASCPYVRGAMMAGQRQFQPMAIIELQDGAAPPANSREREEMLETLTQFIEAANRHAPAHAQLDRHHLIFAAPARPIQYLGQGKIQRRRTYQMCEGDIAAAYRALESASHDEILAWLRRQLEDIAPVDLDPTDDFFRAGIDSLQVMKLAREVAGISATDIYQNYTLDSLAGLFLSRRSPESASSESDRESADTVPTEACPTEVDEMHALLQCCVADLPPRAASDVPMTVLLTGSTGSLGSYLLDTLYHAPGVQKIIFLNRSVDAESKQSSAARARGLYSSWDPQHVAFLHADLSAPFLGIASTEYQTLVDDVTHVVHNQWPVNFHWRITSFDTVVRGVRNLVDLCLGSTRNAVLLFVSSVSAVGAWQGPGPVPEDPVTDLSCATMGYGQAKLVSECLLNEAAAASGLRAAVCRVGIVAGPVEREQGMWNRQEYIPALINSSVHLECFPTSFPSRDHVDWLPVDKVARVLLETLESATFTLETSEKGSLPVYHVANPHAMSWSNIIPWVVDRLRLQPVSFEQWLDKLENCRDSLEDVDKNPAIKLVDFYRTAGRASVPRRMMTWRAAQASKTLREVDAANEEWMNTWLDQWGLI
ncbi:acetyl-CoA synthetase-like protein [Xylaria venustula]|nr:acetyl-CoA synthetase-like protein [Xylaria venustula]